MEKNLHNTLQISREHNVSHKTILNNISKLGLSLDPKNHWSEDELKVIRDNYQTNPKVYTLFPTRTIHSVNKKANKLGLKRIQRIGKYTLNENFFDKWMPENAYVFGLFCSDGNVGKNERRCGFHISKNDVELLEIIKTVMNSTHPIEIRDEYAYLRMSNRKIVQNLIKLGCPPEKSLTIQFPDIPDSVLNHFVRGYFDGDGSIHFNKPNTIKITLLGTNDFVTNLQNRLYLLLGLQKHKIRKHKKIFMLDYYGDDARKFCSWLYEDNKGYFLNRKYERFRNHLLKRENK